MIRGARAEPGPQNMRPHGPRPLSLVFAPGLPGIFRDVAGVASVVCLALTLVGPVEVQRTQTGAPAPCSLRSGRARCAWARLGLPRRRDGSGTRKRKRGIRSRPTPRLAEASVVQATPDDRESKTIGIKTQRAPRPSVPVDFPLPPVFTQVLRGPSMVIEPSSSTGPVAWATA